MAINFRLMMPPEVINLQERIRQCTACSIRPEASCPVPGVGNNTGIIFVGRNPGAEEDLEGRPFIGPSGKVLDVFLYWAGLRRKDVFLTNLVNCYTFDNRVPSRDEIKICASRHLMQYFRLLKPLLVVTFGAEAAKYVAGVTKLSVSHGDILWHRGIGGYCIPAYHPGAILYDPRQRDHLMTDAAQIRRFLANKQMYVERREARLKAVSKGVEGNGIDLSTASTQDGFGDRHVSGSEPEGFRSPGAEISLAASSAS